MRNPFRYFNSSPEVIRLTLMMYVRYPLTRMSEGNIKNSVRRLVKQAEREFKVGEQTQCNETIAKAMVASTKKPVTRKNPVQKKKFNY